MPNLKLTLPPLNDFPFQKKYQTSSTYALSLPTLKNNDGQPVILLGSTQDKFLKSNCYTTCPGCESIPIITFKNHLLINLHCTNCTFSKDVLISDYLQRMESRHIYNKCCERVEIHQTRNGVQYCSICKQWLCKECVYLHKHCCKDHLLVKEKIDKEFQCLQHLKYFSYYCHKCKCNFCEDCLVDHQTHNIVVIKDTLNDALIKEAYDNFKQAKDYAQNYLKDLKDNIIRNFTLKIKEIEDAYKENFQINRNILLLLGLILDTNEKSRCNYNNVSNLIRNFNFDLIKDDMINSDTTKKNIDKLIYFYQNTFISFKEKFNCANLNNIKLLKEVQTNNETDRWINHILLIDKNNFLFVCKSDGLLQLIDMENFQIYKEIKAHDNAIHYILDLNVILNNKKLFATCSTDKTIKIWSLSRKIEFKLIETLTDHFKRVYKLINLSTKYHFASCSEDESIYIYTKIPPFTKIYSFFAHDKPITSIFQLRDERIVSACSEETKIKVWNFESQKIKEIYKEGSFGEINYKTKNKENDLIFFEYEVDGIKCNNNNSMIQISNGRLLVGGSFIIYIVDIFKGVIEGKIEDKTLGCVCSLMECIGGDVFCGCQYGKLVKINYYDKKIVQSKDEACKVDINDIIRLDEMHFITGDADGSIKLWSY